MIEVPNEPSEPTDPEPVDVLPAVITEIMPNAIGSDTGNEFIELFNPNTDMTVTLEDYKLAIGPSLEKVITLGLDEIPPGEYKVYTNAQLGFTLLNTSSKLTLMSDQNILASEVSYAEPVEGRSWALINGEWQYTNQPTPGAENRAGTHMVEDLSEAESKSSNTSIKPCAANQYRSPETNRCRLVSSATSSSAVCKEGQVRNPETNRCKAVTSSTTVTACKEGQERNPDTNRCRTIKQLAPAGFGVKGATSKQQGGMGWYMWAAIGGIVLLIIGYGVWEWRDELKKAFLVIKAKFARRVN